MNKDFKPECKGKELPTAGCGYCGSIPHKEWCELASCINNRFNKTFREIFNIIDLALDEKKAEIAKSSIGNTLVATREYCENSVINYFSKNSKL